MDVSSEDLSGTFQRFPRWARKQRNQKRQFPTPNQNDFSFSPNFCQSNLGVVSVSATRIRTPNLVFFCPVQQSYSPVPQGRLLPEEGANFTLGG